MGTSDGFGAFAAKLERLGDALGDPKETLNKVGLAGKGIYISHATSAGVYGKKVAGKRKAIGARYDITRNGRGVIVSYTGPAHLVNNPTSRHFIGAKRLGTRKGFAARQGRVSAAAAFGGSNRGVFGQLRKIRNGKQALTIGGNLRAWAFHPGTRGKGFHQRARAQCEKVLPGIAGRSQITQPLKAIFG